MKRIIFVFCCLLIYCFLMSCEKNTSDQIDNLTVSNSETTEAISVNMTDNKGTENEEEASSTTEETSFWSNVY